MHESDVFAPYRRLWTVVAPYLPRYGLGVVFLLLTNAGQLAIPHVIRLALDGIDDVAFSLMLLAVLAIMVALGRVGWRLFIVGAARRVERDIRSQVFHNLTRLEPRFFQSYSVGDIMARLTTDLQTVRMSLGMSVITFVDGTFMGVGIIVLMLSMDWLLGLLTFLPLLLIVVWFLVYGKPLARLYSDTMKGYSSVSTEAQETLTAVRLVQSFHREEHFATRLEERSQTYHRMALRLDWIWGAFYPLLGLLTGLTTWILLTVGGQRIAEGDLSVGSFAAFLAYLGMLVWPMISVGFTVDQFQRGAASLRRLFELADREPGIVSAVDAHRPEHDFPLEVQDLTFRYEEGQLPVLTKVSFGVDRERFIGILGTTASGKSTLIRLLCRLWDPPPNSVRLGGLDVRLWPLSDLRRRFSLVTQSPFLFSDTIRNNILFARPDAKEADLWRCVELAGLSRDLESFPDGLETLIGERGITLSGGQKQRVALARALLALGDILLLDDALSAVDTETESAILDNLLSRGGLEPERRLILVSHRVSAMMRCDTVLVLHEGELVQSGPPQRLLTEEGLFREIALLQHYPEASS